MNDEEKKHGPNHVGQLIGNLTRDMEFEAAQELPHGTVAARLWGGMAIDRPGGGRPSYYVIYIYAGDGVTEDDLKKMAEHLKSGQRVKAQGRLDVRPMDSEIFEELAGALGFDDVIVATLQSKSLSQVFYSGRSSIRCWAGPNDKDLLKTMDQKGKRPITLLPSLNPSKPDMGF